MTLHHSFPFWIVAVISLGLLLPSCDVATENDTGPLRFQTGPSPPLEESIQDEQSPFPWDHFNQGMVVSSPGVEWSRSTVVRIDAFQLRNDEVVHDTSTEAVEVNGEELSAGMTTEQLFSGTQWIPGSAWSRTTTVRIEGEGPSFAPDTFASPSQEEMVSLVRSRTALGPGESLVAVYPVLPTEQNPLDDRPVRVKPFGVIFVE